MPNSILFVDDDPDLRFLMGMSLKHAGYEVHLASGGDQALELIDSTIPELFILDVMMPGMDGFELSRRLRAKPETAQHPIILLSARIDSDSMMQGLESGASLYLHKPIEQERLLQHLSQYFQTNAPQPD